MWIWNRGLGPARKCDFITVLGTVLPPPLILSSKLTVSVGAKGSVTSHNKPAWSWGWSSVGETLPGMHEIWGSVPNTAKKKKQYWSRDPRRRCSPFWSGQPCRRMSTTFSLSLERKLPGPVKRKLQLGGDRLHPRHLALGQTSVPLLSTYLAHPLTAPTNQICFPPQGLSVHRRTWSCLLSLLWSKTFG